MELEFDGGIAHIIYAADNSFAEILSVSLVSLYENSKDMKEIVVYILDSGITNQNKIKLNSIPSRYGRATLVWIQAKNISEELSMQITVDRGSISQYARLFLSRELPSRLSKVLYLDCDIIVNKSIRELWNLDLQGKTIAALMDAFSKYYRRNIGLKPNDIMFNSGVMLIDLVRWREKKIEKRLLEFIQLKNGVIQQGDQGALNAVLSHDIYCFEPRFNSVTIFFDFSYKEMLMYRKPPVYYSQAEVEIAVNDPSIIHFTTSFLSKRPWMKDCYHIYATKWLKYKEMSPWNDNPVWLDKKSGWKQRCVNTYKLLPVSLSIRIAGIMQAYGRPFYYGFLKHN